MSEIESTIRIGVWNALRSCGVGQDACYPIIEATVKELLPKLDQSERVSRLEEALKPFARIGQNLMVEGGWSYGDEIAVELRHNFGVLDTLLVGDFRRARSALNQSDGGAS